MGAIKAIVVLLVGLGLAPVGFAEAQQPARVTKIGLLGAGGLGGAGSGSELFKRELRALGYVEGKNIAIEYRSTEGKRDRLPALADELVRLKVDRTRHVLDHCCSSCQERYQNDPHHFLHRD